MGSCTTLAYGHGDEPEVGAVIGDVSELIARDGSFVWIDLDTPSREELQALAGELGLHQLSVEDALEEHQRDKYVHYEAHVFLVCHHTALGDDRQLQATEIDVFVSKAWLVTVHQGRRDVMDVVAARWDHVRRTEGEGVGFAVYALLDVVVESYFQTLDRFERFYDDAADRVFGDAPIDPAEQRTAFEMRRALNQFARIVGPLSDALDTVVSRDLDRFEDAVAPYLVDVRGEVVKAASEIAALRETAQHLLDTDLILRDYRQNQIMKKVTSWAAIIAVPTLVTGWYGMNVPYPGSGEPWGVATAAGLSLGCSGGLFVLFRRRGWL